MNRGAHTRPENLLSRIKTLFSVVWALVTYQRAVLPQVRSELQRWERRTVKIPDLVLRNAALSAIKEKSSNVEATAVFAILTPRSKRSSALRAMTALQTTIEYLDVLGEQTHDESLADGLALHGALTEAVTPGAPYSDWYRLHPQSEDGGYLAALVATCQREVATLPSGDAVLETAQRAAQRCADGQSYTHAAVGSNAGAEALEKWAVGLDDGNDYRWWELAAGASSSVALHALIAAAANQDTDAEEAERIDAAYFPAIGALTVLLDDLIDRDKDLATEEHNYLDYYASNETAAERFALLTRHSRSAIAGLRFRHRHTAILMGVGGFYLSTPAARSGYARPIRARMIKALGAAVYPILAALRILNRD
jgi:tetraprenyl-beta-curcumene synthase